MRRRNLADRVFVRSRSAREIAAALSWTVRRRKTPDLAHFAFFEDYAVGPVQRDEALLLHALASVVRPATVVEFGFLRGHSAFNFLRALDADARLYSFDVNPSCEDLAERRFGHDRRFTYQTPRQETLTADDVEGRPVDLVFFDGAHELGINQETFRRLLPMLSSHAILAIHDTGTVLRKYMEDWREELTRTERWIGDEYEPQPDERAFVNWLREEHPEFAQLHLHTHRRPRHGMTLLQRSEALRRPPRAQGVARG